MTLSEALERVRDEISHSLSTNLIEPLYRVDELGTNVRILIK